MGSIAESPSILKGEGGRLGFEGLETKKKPSIFHPVARERIERRRT